MRIVLLIGCAVISTGCVRSNNAFVSVGNGNAVPTEWLEKVAKEKGQTFEQTLKELRVNNKAKRIKDHAAKYGITEDEARQQLAYADKHEKIPYLKANRREASVDFELK